MKIVISGKIFLILLCILIGQDLCGQSAEWSWQYPPYNSGIDLYDIHVIDGDEFLAFGESGSVLRYNEGKITVHYGIEGVTGRLLSACFIDELTGWVVGEGGVILHTDNGGLTWTKQESNANAHLNAVFFIDSLHGWSGGSRFGVFGIYYNYIAKTIDGGVTWKTDVIRTEFEVMDFYFKSESVGWMVGRAQIFYTDDGGTSWSQQLINPRLWFTAIAFVDDTTGFVVGKSGIVYYTDTGGEVWQEVDVGVNADLIDIDFVNSSHGWIVARDGSLLITNDGGNTWQVKGSNIERTIQSIEVVSETSAFIVGSGFLVAHTADTGDNWNILTQDLDATDADLRDIYFLNKNLGWVVGDDGTILRTENGGEEWIQLNSGVHERLNSVFFIDDKTGWVVGRNGLLLSTHNGGESWGIVDLSSTDELYAIYFLDKNSGWIIGGRSLLKTTDGGQVWSQSYVHEYHYGMRSMFWINHTVGLVGGYDIFRTTNGGVTWRQLYYRQNEQFLTDIHFVNDLLGWAAGHEWIVGAIPQSRGIIYKTLDGGITWSEILKEASYFITKVDFATPTTGWVVGRNGLILRTTDGGENWEREPSKTSRDIQGLFLLDNTVGWAVGNGGMILSAKLSGVPYYDPVPDTYRLYQNYPNPFNSSTTIRFAVPENTMVTLSIYNTLGKKVETLVSRFYGAGYHSIAWDASNYASGVYYYRISADSFLQTRKLVLVK